MYDARWWIPRQRPDKNRRISRVGFLPSRRPIRGAQSRSTQFFLAWEEREALGYRSFASGMNERKEWLRYPPRHEESSSSNPVSSREFRATLNTWSSIFKDGLRWVSAEPWSPAMRSSPSRKSVGCSRRRSSRRRCTESVASSGNCRSSRGLSSLAARPGHSVFALAPAGWSCCRAATDSIRSDYCCVGLSMTFPAKKEKKKRIYQCRNARMIASAKTLFRQRSYLLTRPINNDNRQFLWLECSKNICI